MLETQAKHQNAANGSSYASQPTPPNHCPPYCTPPPLAQTQPNVIPQKVHVIKI